MRRGTHGPDLCRGRSHRVDRRDIRARLMHFLGVTETCDLGALYLRLKDEGHEVKVAISDPEAHGTLAGLVERVDDWRAELDRKRKRLNSSHYFATRMPASSCNKK